MSYFAITGAEKITLNEGKGVVAFTVTNTSGAGLRARGTVQTDAAQAAWYQLTGEPERDLAANGTTEYQVQVAVPKAAATGDYRFRLQVVATHNSDESKTLGAPVTFHYEAAGKKSKLPLIIGAIAAGVVLMGVVLFLVFSGGDLTVPDVKGTQFADARGQLEQLGLTVEEELRVSDQPEGTVFEQDPAGGTEVQKGASVKLTYEAPLIEMPQLVGLELDAAAALVTQSKLTAGGPPTEQRQDPTRAGRIVDQKPKAGERVRQGATVDLVAEAPLRTVPDVKGKSISDAQAKLRELGLETTLEVERKQPRDAGKITAQEPAANSLIQKGATVALVAEEGRNAVPDVLGQSIEEASRRIAQAGLKAATDPAELFPANFSFDAGTVGNTRPARGEKLLAGDTVNVVPVGVAATVPAGLAGKTQAQAEAAIRAAQLEPVVSSQFTKEKAAGTVLGLDPDGNTRVLKGSKVVIRVATDRLIAFPIDKLKRFNDQVLRRGQ